MLCTASTDLWVIVHPTSDSFMCVGLIYEDNFTNCTQTITWVKERKYYIQFLLQFLIIAIRFREHLLNFCLWLLNTIASCSILSSNRHLWEIYYVPSTGEDPRERGGTHIGQWGQRTSWGSSDKTATPPLLNQVCI